MISRRDREGFGYFALVCALCLFLYYHSSSRPSTQTLQHPHSPVTCDIISALNDVLVAVKTGACEDSKRLLVQSATSLQCLPPSSLTYVSDLDETIGHIRLENIFTDVNEEYIDQDDEFVLYKKLQRDGNCKDIDPEDLKAKHAAKTNGNNDNRGWNLDKWKFLPMCEKMATLREDAKWFIQIEVDTYVVWHNMIQFLSQLDYTSDHYLGSPMFVGGASFIYGGSGAVLSQAAMQKVAEHIRQDNAELQQFTHEHWAGDHVMGKALTDVDVHHTTMSREFVRDSMLGADYGFHWCTGALTFHHVSGEEAASFHAWESAWFAENPGKILRHKDIFKGHVLPKFPSYTEDWSNNSEDQAEHDGNAPRNVAECEEHCFLKAGCVQYRWVHGVCYTSKIPRIGSKASGSQSGWFVDKIETWIESHPPCTGEQVAWSPQHD